MIVERKNNEILVRFSAETNIAKIQAFLDYFRYLELTSKSKATQKDIDNLARKSKSKSWEKIKKEMDFND